MTRGVPNCESNKGNPQILASSGATKDGSGVNGAAGESAGGYCGCVSNLQMLRSPDGVLKDCVQRHQGLVPIPLRAVAAAVVAVGPPPL